MSSQLTMLALGQKDLTFFHLIQVADRMEAELQEIRSRRRAA
jgi:hypothetical protein